VWPDDDDLSFARVIDGVRNGVETAVSGWNDAARALPSTEWLRGAGIAGGLALLMVAVLLNRGIATGFPDVGALLQQPSPLRMLAWLVISFGLAEGVSKLIPPIEHYDSYFQLALGFIIVPISAPLAKALRMIDTSMKDTITIKDQPGSEAEPKPIK
jgi:hypothetical protein